MDKATPESKVVLGIFGKCCSYSDYTAMIAYVTVGIMKEELKIKYSNYEILQIVSITLLNKTLLKQLFEQSYLQNFKELNSNQLKLIELC